MHHSSENTTHFGFRTVEKTEKAKLVREVFDNVASNYDRMNDVMSGGMHRLWKDEMVTWLNPKPEMQILDVAGGTGDIAFRIRNASIRRYGAAPDITICDINAQMLGEGRKRAVNHNILQQLEWVCGDAQNLPLPANSIDAYTIAFGIRNVTDIDAALREANRILKPGGRFMCMEFSQVQNPLLAKFYDIYSMQVIPRMGKLVAGSAEPYQYLVESIRRFPDQQSFKRKIEQAGFAQVIYRNLSAGAVAIHSGWKI